MVLEQISKLFESPWKNPLILCLVFSINLELTLNTFLSPAGQMEDCGGGGGLDPLAAGGGAAETDYRDEERHAGPSRGASARLPQHRHQGLRAAAALPSLSQGQSTRLH